MPKTYSEDLRGRIAKDVGKGARIRAVAEKYSVSPSFVSKISRLWRQEGRVAARRMGGYKRHALHAQADAVRHKLAGNKGITLQELKDWAEEALGIRVHVSSVDRFVRALGYSYKKTLRASEQERADVALARAVWQEWQTPCDPSRLVFLDETGAATDMTRLHGRSPVGERCHDFVPGGHWKTTTFIAGLRLEGMVAPWCLDGAMDGATFLTYVRHVLVPVLRPGDIVVCDNLGSHKVEGVREAIKAAGAVLLYLPAYSPDLNPIEQAFSKIKALLRKAAERSVEARWKTIGRVINLLSAQECKNYFTNAGYVLN